MAKKLKADFFPHYAHFGKTIDILESKWGNSGYAVWFKLLQILCASDNHTYDCSTPEAWEWLVSRMRVPPETVTGMVGLLAKLGQVDAELWREKVLWCPNLIKNLEPVYKKRQQEIPERPALKSDPPLPVPGSEATPPNLDQEGEIDPDPGTEILQAEQSREEKRRAEQDARAREEAAAAPAIASTQDPDAPTPLNLDTLSTRLLDSGFGFAPPVITDIFRGLQKKGEGWDFLEFVMDKAAGKDSGKREGFIVYAIVKKDSVWHEWKLKEREKPPPPKAGLSCPGCGRTMTDVSGIFACPGCHERWEIEGGELVKFGRVGPEVLPEPEPEQEEEVVF